MRKFLTTGLFGAILGLAVGAPADAALVSRGFLDEALENYATTTALDVKANQSDFTDLSDKIGTLPSGDIYPLKGLAFLLPDTEYYTYPTSIGDFMGQMYGGYLGLSGLADAVYHGNEYTGQTDTAFQVKGLRQITDEIGTLPSGNFTIFPGHESLFPVLNQPLTYPTSLAELITAIYGNSETGGPGLLAAIITGFPIDPDGDGQSVFNVGLIPTLYIAADAKELATTANTTATAAKTAADANTAKIGLLPPDTTVAGMMGNPVLLNREHTIIPLSELIVAGSNGQMVVNPITGDTLPIPLLGLLDITAKVNKIGELPTEYATVGAALTAIKGIAEDAKAAALAAIPDPKAEGSTGKFVLTVDIVGDNATYRWEKIDREGETTTTTE